MTYGSVHFPPKDMNCPCEGCYATEPTPETQRNLIRLAGVLERIRTILGTPVIVTSALRCAAHNAAVGGEAQSVHLKGLAADIRVSGHNGESLLALLKDLIKHGILPDGGLGVYKAYPRIVHYDLARPRRWRR